MLQIFLYQALLILYYFKALHSVSSNNIIYEVSCNFVFFFFVIHLGHRRDSERDDKTADLPPRQRGRNDRRRVTDEDESVLDSHEVSSITSMDQGEDLFLSTGLKLCKN